MKGKGKLSVTVDLDLISAAEQATKRGESVNLSAWVNEAMRLRFERDSKLRGLAAYMAAYEAEFGAISDEETTEALREAKRRAIPARGLRAGESRKRYGR